MGGDALDGQPAFPMDRGIAGPSHKAQEWGSTLTPFSRGEEDKGSEGHSWEVATPARSSRMFHFQGLQAPSRSARAAFLGYCCVHFKSHVVNR